MSDLVITAANVKAGSSDNRVQLVQAGEAITQGQPCYLAGDGKYYQTDANDTATKAQAKGIALSPASTDGYFYLTVGGLTNLGATLTQGQIYVVSNVKGGIAPYADLVSGDYVTILGTAQTSSLLKLNINITGITKA